MSQVAISGNASGTGTLTIASPNTNSNYTLTLPTATTELVGTDATQTLTNKTIQGGAITSGTSVASTSGTSVNFTGIPIWVKRITVMYQGVSTNGSAEPLIRIGTSGGIQSSGYLGASTFFAVGSMGARPYSTAPASSTGFAWFNSVSAAELLNGAVTLSLMDSSTGTWALNGMLGDSAGNDAYMSAGTKTLSGTLDRVRITTTNGTDLFDAGSINIMYEG